MELTITLLTEQISRCESEIKYYSKFLEMEKDCYPDRYKNDRIKINRLKHKIESYQRTINYLTGQQSIDLTCCIT